MPAIPVPARRSGPALALAGLSLVAAACGGTSHDAVGLVLKLQHDTRTVTISHEPIAGLMDAMVMPLHAARGEDLSALQPGDRIAFRLTVRGGATSIDRLRVLSAAPGGEGGPAAPHTSALAVGAALPPFALTDQRGAAVTPAALHGKVAVVSFIYTRCPLPDYCPRVMTHFSALRDRFAERLGRDLVLLQVTFDPKHDTPERLREFADRYGANVAGWHLLTGTTEAIARVCASFGVEYYPDEGMISHTLQTAVIDRDGRLAARAEGREFGAKQLGDLVEVTLGAVR